MNQALVSLILTRNSSSGYHSAMENKKRNIGTFLRDAFLIAFGLAWFCFVAAALMSEPPKVDCTGKSEAECQSLQKKTDDNHQRQKTTLLLLMG